MRLADKLFFTNQDTKKYTHFNINKIYKLLEKDVRKIR